MAATYKEAMLRSTKMQQNKHIDERSLINAGVLLHNSGVVIEGVTFFGTPYGLRSEATSYSGFELASEEELAKVYSKNPTSTDVLLTLCGPHGVLDRATKDRPLGSKSLLERVDSLSCDH